MYAHLKRPVTVGLPFFPRRNPAWLTLCALLWCGQAAAEDTSDPYSTMARLTHKPALDQGSANPCAETQTALDLYSVVNIALCNNPQTRETWANSQAQAAQIGVSQSSYLPNVSASLTENRNAPGNSQRSLGLSLSYLLYDFGARAANLESARQLLASVNAAQDNTVQTLFLAAVQAYYQTQATQAAFDAATVSEHAAETSFLAARARHLAGSATPADKLSAQTAYSQATLNRVTALGAMNIARGNLANLLGLDADRSLTLAKVSQDQTKDRPPPELEKILEQSVTALIDAARQNRPDLKAAQAQVLAAQASVDAARAAAKPALSLTASTSQNNSAGINTHGTSLGVSLTAPLFSGYAPTYRIRAASAQVDVKKAQMERIRLQIALDVWTAYQNLLTATQNRRTTTDLLGSAEQSERVALGRYKAGVGTMLELLNAQTTLAGARQLRIQADLNWNIGRTTLAQAVGTLDTALLLNLPDIGTSSSPKP
ncbi:MAG: TolC family protein [Gallionella sp.]|nr:TolC family protein [Gallionella sp.]